MKQSKRIAIILILSLLLTSCALNYRDPEPVVPDNFGNHVTATDVPSPFDWDDDEDPFGMPDEDHRPTRYPRPGRATPTPYPTRRPRATATPYPTRRPRATATPAPTRRPRATATPAPTRRPRATATPEPTRAPRATATPSPTNTPRPTATPTPTPTPTKAPKATATPTPTNTPRPTRAPRATATPTPTNTPRPTRAPRATATPTPTNTPRPTATTAPTATPTNPPTPTATTAPTATPTNTPVPTATTAPTATPTNTPAPTATTPPTATPTNTPVPTATNTPTPTATDTPTPTNSPTPTESPSPTAAQLEILYPEEYANYSASWGFNYLRKLDDARGDHALATLYQRYYHVASVCEGRATCQDLNVTVDEMRLIPEFVYIDNPQLIQIVSAYSWSYSGNIAHSVRPDYVCDKNTAARLLAQCEASFEEIKAQIIAKYGSLDAASKVQKAKIIHDYLVLSKEYQSSVLDQTMAGALSDEFTPVCMSYSLAFKWCCNKLGIQCEIIYGVTEGENHAWNIINYGENVDYYSGTIDPSTWYEMDVTWDDPTNMNPSYITYDYFNLTTEQMNRRGRRVRDYGRNVVYAVENCTGTALSYQNCVANGIFD